MSYFTQFNSSNRGIPFMDACEKANVTDLFGRTVHITDFGFIRDKDGDGDFAAFTISEEPGKFYFGNAILTDMLKKVDADGKREALPFAAIKFDQRTSKKGRQYVGFEFVEE